MRKIISLFLTFVLLGTQIASAAAYTLAGYDGEDSTHDWSTNDFFVRMAEETGISFTFDEYTDPDKWQEAKDSMFASGDLPDVLFKAGLTVEEQIRYSDNGTLIDLLPLLAENAPNLWALLQENPEWLAAITLPSGKVAALPTINTLAPQNAMWINQTWLDTLGLDAPIDFESLLTVLYAFQTQDPNQNGKQDEIPLSYLGPWDLKFLAHAFGLVANDYNIYVDDNGQVQFMPLADEFIDFLSALHTMYANGLLDENGFTTADTLRIVSDDDDDVTYGLFFGPNPYTLFTVALGDQFSMLDPLLYDGAQVYRDLSGPIVTGTFAITSACDNPEELLSWVDVLYAEDGAIKAMSGTLDVDYQWGTDGMWSYTDDVENDSSYILYDLSIYDTGYMPWLFPSEFYAAYDVESLQRTTDSLIDLRSYLVDPFPYYYVLSVDQRAVIDPLQAELGVCVDESIAKFILGELDITSSEDINGFYSRLNDLGLEKFLSFWQEIYDQQRIR